MANSVPWHVHFAVNGSPFCSPEIAVIHPDTETVRLLERPKIGDVRLSKTVVMHLLADMCALFRLNHPGMPHGVPLDPALHLHTSTGSTAQAVIISMQQLTVTYFTVLYRRSERDAPIPMIFILNRFTDDPASYLAEETNHTLPSLWQRIYGTQIPLFRDRVLNARNVLVKMAESTRLLTGPPPPLH